MSDVLSQSEVESLLAALDGGDASPARPAPARDERESPAAGLNTSISVYDFKRPERVSKEQMRAFHALHEGFSREFGAVLSGMLRTIVECKLISVDQLTYSEFVFSLENPTCFNLLESDGLDGHVILDINPAIIFPIIDRLLGGGKEGRPEVPMRPLTEIEKNLVARITGAAIRGLETAWQNIVDLDLRVSQVESNPQLVQIVPPNEVVVLISFEVVLGEMRGIMNYCMPFNAIEPLSGKLTSDTWSNYTRRTATREQRLNLEAGVSRAAVRLTAELASTTITAGDLADIAVGDVIVTDHDRQDGIEIRVEDRPMFHARPGVLKGHKAIRLEDPIERPKDFVARLLAEDAPDEGDGDGDADSGVEGPAGGEARSA